MKEIERIFPGFPSQTPPLVEASSQVTTINGDDDHIDGDNVDDSGNSDDVLESDGGGGDHYNCVQGLEIAALIINHI